MYIKKTKIVCKNFEYMFAITLNIYYNKIEIL